MHFSFWEVDFVKHFFDHWAASTFSSYCLLESEWAHFPKHQKITEHYCDLLCLPPEHGLERTVGQESEAAVCADHPGRQRRQQLRWWIYLRGSDLNPAQGTPSAELRRAAHVLWLWLHRGLGLAFPDAPPPPIYTHAHTLWTKQRSNDCSSHLLKLSSSLAKVLRRSSEQKLCAIEKKLQTPPEDPDFFLSFFF